MQPSLQPLSMDSKETLPVLCFSDLDSYESQLVFRPQLTSINRPLKQRFHFSAACLINHSWFFNPSWSETRFLIQIYHMYSPSTVFTGVLNIPRKFHEPGLQLSALLSALPFKFPQNSQSSSEKSRDFPSKPLKSFHKYSQFHHNMTTF